MNKTRNTVLTALAVAAVLIAAPHGAYAQGGRRTTATQQQQQQQEQVTKTTTGTSATTPQTNSGTSTTTRRQTTGQPAQNTTTTRQTTTTNTRQSTPQVNTQPSQPVSRPTNTSGTSTTNRRQDATNAQRPANQPSQPAVQPNNNSQQPSGNRQNPQPGVRPGGSSSHQNGNGNAVRPANQSQSKPNGQKITPGYMPNAISHKPPKHPEYYKPNKPYRPKPYYELGYHMFGTRINTLPVGHVVRNYRNSTYYYYNGVFYKHNNLSGYIISRPPVGFSFNAYNSSLLLPYVLIDPYRDPSVRISEAIALSRLYARMYPGYRMLDESFYFENVLHQQVNQYWGMDGIYYTVRGGAYTVVDPPIGAITDRLPYDYEEIWLGGDLFYLVDNILYGVVAPEGVPYFEIFSIL